MFKVIRIDTDENCISIFKATFFEKSNRGGLIISDQIGAKNFRLRESSIGYATDWHLAGDPTMIIIQKGVLRISLRNGQYQDFKAGEVFIAADNLPKGIDFNNNIHGHKAEVIGNEMLVAAHIKLDGYCT
jgi:hypothetical protein